MGRNLRCGSEQKSHDCLTRECRWNQRIQRRGIADEETLEQVRTSWIALKTCVSCG